MRRFYGFCILAALLLLVGVGLLLGRRHLPDYREAKSWESVSAEGSVQGFSTDPEATMKTLMNRPGSHKLHHPSMPEAVKHIESHGFASDTELAERPSRPRLIFVGDEMTYGFLPNQLTLPAQAASLLEGSFDVINAGRPEESTYTSLLRLKHVVRPSTSDVVVVVWPLVNDLRELEEAGVYRGPRLERPSDAAWNLFWEDGEPLPSVSAEDSEHYIDEFQSYVAMKRNVFNADTRSTFDDVLYRRTGIGLAASLLRYAPGEAYQHIQRFRDALARTLSICRALRDQIDAPVVILLLPDPLETEAGRVQGHTDFNKTMAHFNLHGSDLRMGLDLRDWMKHLLTREGIPFIEPSLTMRQEAKETPLFAAHDWTLSAAGCEVLAQQVAAFIEQAD